MEKNASASIRIAKKRTVPALLLFDLDGTLRFSNAAAGELLSKDQSEGLLKSVRSAIRKFKGNGFSRVTGAVSPAGPFLQDTFASGRRSYSIQAFLLNHEPEGQKPMVGVLCERMNPTRVDFSRARRRFGLSPREVEVVQALVLGMSDKEIASSLGIGFETVRDYLKKIRSKLGVSSRTAILSALLMS